MVLGIETSCDETAAAVVMGGFDVLSSVVSSQVDLHAQFGGVVPEIAGRAHLELIMPVVARAIVEAGVDDAPDRRRGRDGRARARRLAARRGGGRQGAGADVGRALRRRQPPRGAPLRRLPGGARPRAAPRRAAGVGRPHDARRDARTTASTASSGRRSTTPPARPSTRWPATSASATPAARPSTALAMQGDPAAIALSPGDAARGARLLLQWPEDGRDQPRAQAPRRRDRRRGGQLPAGRGRRAGGQGRDGPPSSWAPRAWPSAVASRPTRCCASSCSRPASQDDLHGFLPSRAMCTDNAAMIAATGWHRLRLDGPTPLDRGRRPQPPPPPRRLRRPRIPLQARPPRGTADACLKRIGEGGGSAGRRSAPPCEGSTHCGAERPGASRSARRMATQTSATQT